MALCVSWIGLSCQCPEDGASDAKDDPKDYINDDQKYKSDDDGQKGLGIVQIQALANGDEPCDQGPDPPDQHPDARDDPQDLRGLGEADHAQHLPDVRLPAEEARPDKPGHYRPEHPADQGAEQSADKAAEEGPVLNGGSKPGTNPGDDRHDDDHQGRLPSGRLVVLHFLKCVDIQPEDTDDPIKHFSLLTLFSLGTNL